MKVHELIKELHRIDPNLEVVSASDAEGSDFSPVSDICLGYVEPLWEQGRLDDVLFDDSFDDPDEAGQYKKIVVVWPV